MSAYRFALALTGWVLVLLASLAARSSFIDRPIDLGEAIAWVAFGCAPVAIVAVLRRESSSRSVSQILYDTDRMAEAGVPVTNDARDARS